MLFTHSKMQKSLNTNKTMKEQIDIYFSKNYEKIVEISKNCLLKNNLFNRELEHNLTTQCYEYLLSIDKEFTDDNELKSYIINYINKQIVWCNTQFKKEHIYPYLFDRQIDKFFDLEEENEKNYVNIEIKMQFLDKFIEQLEFTRQILFNLIYREGYNTNKKLATHLKISIGSAYLLKKKLKDDIQQYVKDNFSIFYNLKENEF